MNDFDTQEKHRMRVANEALLAEIVSLRAEVERLTELLGDAVSTLDQTEADVEEQRGNAHGFWDEWKKTEEALRIAVENGRSQLRYREQAEAEVERLQRDNEMLKESFSFLRVDPETNLSEVERLRAEVTLLRNKYEGMRDA